MRFGKVATVSLVAALGALALLSACGGDDGGGDFDSSLRETAPAGTAASPGASGGRTVLPGTTPAASPTTARSDSDDLEIEACKLLTAAEIKAAMGLDPPEGEPEDFAPFFSCDYDWTTGPLLSVVVIVFPKADDAKDFFEDTIKRNDYEKIAGLGDGAYTSEPLGTLAVLKGRYEVDIDIYGLEDSEDALAIAKQLAAKALPRLP